MIGSVVRGNLRIVSLLGQGGMGSVYLAENVDLPEMKCAVKVLRSELTDRPDFQARFFDEARSQAGLDHPNVVRVLDYFQERGCYFLVLAFVDGGSLAKLIETEGALPPARALPLFEGILEGLDCAHKHGIIHRDVKPSNVLIDADGRARVTDFGIALQAGSARLTASGAPVGTAAYMSPEQIAHPRRLDHRTDVYSAGVVLFEMLTGRVPFDGPTDFAVQEQHVKQPPPDPRSIAPGIAPALARIVLRALAKDPDERYSGCADFLQAIRAYRAPPMRWPVGVATGLLVAAGLAVMPWMTRPPPSAGAQQVADTLVLGALQALEQLCREAAQRALKEQGRQLARDSGEPAYAERFDAQVADLTQNIERLTSQYWNGIRQLGELDDEVVRRAIAQRPQQELASAARAYLDALRSDLKPGESSTDTSDAGGSLIERCPR